MVSATVGAPIKATGARIQGFAATTRRKEVSASHQSATNSSSPAVTAWSDLKDLPRHPSFAKGIVAGHSWYSRKLRPSQHSGQTYSKFQVVRVEFLSLPDTSDKCGVTPPRRRPSARPGCRARRRWARPMEAVTRSAPTGQRRRLQQYLGPSRSKHPNIAARSTTRRMNYVRAPGVSWHTENDAGWRIMGAMRDPWGDTPSRSVIGSKDLRRSGRGLLGPFPHRRQPVPLPPLHQLSDPSVRSNGFSQR
jgi:hypothetical protein